MSTYFRKLVFILLAAIIFLAGCGSNPPATTQAPATSAKAEQKPPAPSTARQCFTNTVSLAQRWEPDALPFHMESQLTGEATGQGGTATVWTVIFGSQSRGTMRTFICSGSRLSSAPAFGLTSTSESAYPSNVPALMFHPSYFQNDSDKAFETSLEHGGTALIKKDSKQPVLYLLDWDTRQRELLWTLIYGTNQSDRQGVAVINATNGNFVRAGR